MAKSDPNLSANFANLFLGESIRLDIKRQSAGKVERGRLMKILDKFFSKSTKNHEPEDVMKIARIIGPLVDKKVQEIFGEYKMKLLNEPITYIVPAVWGAKKDGELTATQKEINEQVVPVIIKIIESFQVRNLSGAQAFAIGFLTRGLIIAKITYMIEGVKNRVTNKNSSWEENTDILKDLEPLGTA